MSTSITEDIDFKALFEQLQTENEGLRLRIVKMKNEGITFTDWIKEKMSAIADSEYFMLYFYAALMIVFSIIVPIVKALFLYLLRRFSRNEG